MSIIKSPVSWGCLAASAAMALKISYETLINEIGHDGSTIIFPELPEPGKRRGFHMQEIIDVAIKRGVAVTPIEALSYSTPDGLKEFALRFGIEKIKRFQNHLTEKKGIITGMKRIWRHAVYWDGKMIHDPIGQIYPYVDITMDIDCFWLFTEIKSF